MACKEKLNLTWIEFGKVLGLNARTIRYWSIEKKRMSHSSFLILSKIPGISIPDNIEILKWSDHARKAGIKGGVSHYEKYGCIGNEDKRKAAWSAWWEKKGKYKGHKIYERKVIDIPEKDVLLAEFGGIAMGDGGMTNQSLTITLDSKADIDYIPYVISLINNLFGVMPRLYKRKKQRAVDIIVSSRNLVEFCISIGLKKGDKIKQNLDIPDWIKSNGSYSLACIRGLVDTDGCFFSHAYKVNGKEYTYPKIAFTSKSPLLLDTVSKILIKLEFYVRMTKDGNDIRIENQNDVVKYIEMIGSSNPKFNIKVKFGDVIERSNMHLC